MSKHDSLEPVSKRRRRSLLTPDARNIIDVSQRRTKSQYGYRQQAYKLWCDARTYDPFDPSPTQPVNYLAGQHTVRKLKASTFYTYSSAILSMFPTDDQNDIRTSTIYLEFMKVLRSQTIQPTKHWAYDISPAIEFLPTLDPISPSPRNN
ncbi:hypothetical protein RMATCC62417_18578 [Rhizopus microsporus]|nr:hypothetical protein RMATCC62417_18578 [Rhizopus microsporus]